ncbi:coiled-coil domain-containing protein 50-like isoform X3 [Anneissia japonica]|uniref:coiled-coil domain-containing protein 50-like isoform X3 n=1 Tax=Anneissia japonica TaxID=1529436 RepID=UPI0014257C0F|nr:coiled-coil domain-containing protein 50-like isoform X3 [Anneissia japonica]
MAGVGEKAPDPPPKPISGNVVKVCQKFGVLEDGVLAHTLQEEEFQGHYSGNIDRRRTVRKDIKTAKQLASEAAIETYAEEHEYVQRLKSIEEQDKETAREMYREMLEEEKRKLNNMKAVHETDQEIAKRLQKDEVKEIEREKMDRESERLARQLSQQEEVGAVGGVPMKRQEPLVKVLTDEELAKRMQAAEIKKMREMHQRREAESQKLARQVADNEQYKSSDASEISNGDSRRTVTGFPNGAGVTDCDSDEDTDHIAQATKDEILARKLQMQENQQQGQKTEEKLKLMKHDEIIARKMQHEEAMIAKRKVYKRYQEKVDNEVAYLEDEQQVDITNASSKLGSPQSGVQQGQSSSMGPPLPPPNANVFTVIDPTYRPAPNSNVRLIKQTSLSDDAPKDKPKAEAPSRTKSKKDKSKEKEKAREKGKEESKEKNEDRSVKKKRSSFFGKKK